MSVEHAAHMKPQAPLGDMSVTGKNDQIKSFLSSKSCRVVDSRCWVTCLLRVPQNPRASHPTPPPHD